ncbi:MAG: hypothetical protein LBT47_14195 [Deltaproteobacteria bacterium]|nr:hypothetical protein [Deltaproteobacteria bacterium]
MFSLAGCNCLVEIPPEVKNSPPGSEVEASELWVILE